VSHRSVGACILCLCGIVLVVGFDYGELKGNLFAVASAVLYSAYSLVLRAKSPDNVDVSMSMMFGFVGQCSKIAQLEITFKHRMMRATTGLFSFVGFGALLPILHYAKVEVCILVSCVDFEVLSFDFQRSFRSLCGQM
jgi:drug/metabolite transporter (DMT)-like permease